MTADARPSPHPAVWIWRAAIVLGWAMILSGLGLSGWDGLLWLRNGYWSRESLADLWGSSPLGGDGAAPGWDDMRGLHYLLYHVLHWLGHCPVNLALVVLGVLTAWIGNGLHERAELRPNRRGIRVRARRSPSGWH